jgi:uncharacterized protein YecA (UPF0149 family)
VRLAYEKGLLSRRNLTRVQHWALLYWMWMDRRTKKEDERAFLIQQTLNLNPDQWVELGYREEMMKALGITDEPEEQGEDFIPFTPEDEDAIEQFLRQQDQIAAKRWIRAGMLPDDFVPDTKGTPV